MSNAWGTLTVLDAAAACGAGSFVNISTDKAADPVSVLGYSKRVAERLTAQLARQANGRYLSVRFGNVLGSRGSFLTTLSAQAASGGPLTVTHPQVSRYFMTAGEAVQLVLQAAVIGRDGEALVLDMGEQIRIADIAYRLAAGASDQPAIVFTGLRPGEKLTESLLGDGETGKALHHPLIWHVPVPPLSPEFVTGIDPGLPPEELRAALAWCASRDSGLGRQQGDRAMAAMPSPRPASPGPASPRQAARSGQATDPAGPR
jgi:FlaA1/EpsC-like NDP-sugar epimerase